MKHANLSFPVGFFFEFLNKSIRALIERLHELLQSPGKTTTTQEKQNNILHLKKFNFGFFAVCLFCFVSLLVLFWFGYYFFFSVFVCLFAFVSFLILLFAGEVIT